MRILHISISDHMGGADRAACRLHIGLRGMGVDSRMLVRKKIGSDPFVFPISSNDGFIRQAMQRNLIRMMQRARHTDNPEFHSLNLFSSGLARQINESDAEVVHLHWFGMDMLGVGDVANIKKPLVWTLHDMWAFCGSEHYDDLNSPGRFREGYTRKNRPASQRGPDLDRMVWNRKRRLWKRPFQLIAPSWWMASQVRESALMNTWPIAVIPNGIDTRRFKPVSRESARDMLNLPRGKRYLLFGSNFSLKNRRKGFHLLCKALAENRFNGETTDIELLVFGARKDASFDEIPCPVRNLGRIDDERALSIVYSAADVFLAPSMQDNLPNTVMEALSCGTPCVAFDTGGMGDLIAHKENGFLATPFCADQFAKGIRWVLDRNENQLRQSARRSVEQKFDMTEVARRHMKLYETIQF